MCLAQSGLAGRNGLASNKQTTPPGSCLHRPSAKRNGPSFNHLIGDQQDVTVDRQSHRSRSLQIDDQLELGRSLHRQVRRLRPFEYLVHIRGGAPEQIVEVRSVRHETSGVHELPRLIHPRQPVARREFHDAPVLAEQHAQVLEDTRSKEIVMGAQAPGSTQFDYPVLANKLFGFKFKVVTGYESTPKIHLAMESGEVDGTIANWSTLKAINTNWITEKKIRVLAQWALQKSPELDGVPLFLDVANTEGERAALRLMLARLEYDRPFFLPPNVPAARIEALRRAFDATMKDPAYLAEADKLKIDVEPLSGEQVAALIEQVSRTPADTVARVRAALENR